MNYDTNAPQVGDILLFNGGLTTNSPSLSGARMKLTVTNVVMGEWPRLNKVSGVPAYTKYSAYRFNVPPNPTAFELSDDQYREAYSFADRNLRETTPDEWLANFHAGWTKLRIGTRHEPKRYQQQRHKRYTLVEHLGMWLFGVEIIKHDNSKLQVWMSREQWMRFFR